MSGNHHLYVPGPSNVPAAVQQAIHCPMEDHRNPTIPDLIRPINEDLKKILLTKTGRVVFFPSSGTGCWEAALQSTLNMGDKVLGASFGQFSMLWLDMCKRLGFEPIVMDEEWGTGANPENYHKHLSADKNHEIKAVLVCQNETATGVRSDVKAIRKVLDDLNHPALLMVDGVSSVASYEFKMEEWGVDCVVSGSQKGFMLPAGLGILGVSQKAIDQMKQSTDSSTETIRDLQNTLRLKTEELSVANTNTLKLNEELEKQKENSEAEEEKAHKEYIHAAKKKQEHEFEEEQA
mgnify:CR=1 FL=1